VGEASIAIGHACYKLIAQKLCPGHAKSCEDLSVSRSLFFRMKNLLDDDMTWVQTDATIAAIQAAVAENPQQSMRQPARHHRMDQRTMRSLVKED
jgi:hypothetical protein